MMWLLFAVALLLFALSFREFYQDPDSPVTRPTGDRSRDQAWYSKIDSQAPIDGDDAAYIRVITQFYDEVYAPAETRPTKNDLDAFVAKLPAPFNPEKRPDGTPNANHKAIVEILETGFRIGRAGTAAAREQAELVTTGALAGFKGANLQPSDGYDEVYGYRTQDEYEPADKRPAVLFPEGEYEPTRQTEPRRPGEPDPDEGSWTGVRFFSFE